MLKLLKYEWKACARTCFPIYGAALLLSIIGRLIMSFESSLNSFLVYRIVEAVGMILYSGILIAVFGVTLVVLIQRFYKNLLGSEGYLMFTLPVSTSQLIWSKALITFAISFISIIAAAISILILYNGTSTPVVFFQGIYQALGIQVMNFSGFVILLETLAFCILGAMGFILFVYLCIALGHLAKKHRDAMAVVWFFVLSTALQFIGAMLMAGIVNTPLRALISWVVYFPETNQVQILLLMSCLLCLAVDAGFFFGTKYILKNRLNLE